MAGAAKIHKKLHQRLAELAELARKLVDACLAVIVALPAEQTGPAISESKKNRLECRGETPGFLLGVDAGTGGACERESGAKHLGGFFVGESAGKFFEVRNAIGAVEKHVNGETHAEVVRELFKPGAKFAGLRDDLVQCGFANQFLAVHADDGRSRSRAGASENGAQTPRKKMLDQPHPRAGVVEQRATGFDKNRFAREPKICHARRHDAVLLIDLARKQFCVETALVHCTCLTSSRLSKKKNYRERRQFRACCQTSRGHFACGFADENVDILRGSGRPAR